jgi:O-antigen/teichoic acid export membrane protein
MGLARSFRAFCRLPVLRWSGTRSHVFWSGMEAVISGLLSCVSAFAIARIIGPAELGTGAAVVAVHVLLWVGVNALFADALVQRAEVSDDTVNSAFWASGAIGCLAGAIQAAAGSGLAYALHDPRVLAMSLVLALTLPLAGAAGPVQGMLNRQRAYKILAGRAAIGQGSGAAIGIAVALHGGGAWALVIQQVCVTAAGALALLLRAPWRLRWGCSWAAVRELLRIGLPLTASTLIQLGRYRLFALLIGATAGPAALGQVHLAFRLVDTVRDLLMTALWRLLLPVMAGHQDDPQTMLACVDRSLARIGLVVFPLCAVMALAIQPLVGILLGPAWAEAGNSAQWLVVLMAYVLAGFPGGIAGIALGQPKYALFTNIAALAATLSAAALLRPATPWQAVAVWGAAQALTSPYGLAMNARLLRVSILRPLRAGLPSLAAAFFATVAGFAFPAAFGAASSDMWLIVERLLYGTLVFLPFALLVLVPTIGNHNDRAQSIPQRVRP